MDRRQQNGKVIHITPNSHDSYVKAWGRKLPLHECLINRSWKQGGTASIILTRQLPDENLIMGAYLVDMFCLGLKDTWVEYNISQTRYEQIKISMPETNYTSCKYSLAHNIIFRGIDFSRKFEFHPPKQFELTRYLLDEDDDQIECIDLEFGNDGVPCVVIDSQNNHTELISKLNGTVGNGNYHVIDLGKQKFGR